MVGCATQPPPKVDLRCDKVGLYARSVVTLRDIGVPLADINKHHHNKDPKFPYLEVNRLAYQLKTKNPAEAYAALYQTCTYLGYDVMAQSFKK